jgi:predicted transposase YdaD
MIPNPHDALFRGVFGQPEHARGALQSVVPAELSEALDWATLALQPGSFVDGELRGQYTDLLYAVTRRDGATCSCTSCSSTRARCPRAA